MERMELVIKSRLVATEKQLGQCSLPRIIRVTRKLKFTENETKIAIYALISQCGYDRADRFGDAATCIATSQFLEIPLKDVLCFLSGDRAQFLSGGPG